MSSIRYSTVDTDVGVKASLPGLLFPEQSQSMAWQQDETNYLHIYYYNNLCNVDFI